MLRTGYSGTEVQRELSSRHFWNAPNETEENALRQSGASAELIAALKSGAYAIPAEEVASAKAQLEAGAARHSAQAEQARKADTKYRAQLLKERSAPTPAAAAHPLAALMRGDLVALRNGAIGHFDDEGLAKKKLIALYFSAHWCGPCRKFTPQLVEFYNRISAQHPEFELVFVSHDRSLFAMETYMRDNQMPWPAVDFQKLPGKDALKKYAGEGIPCLVVIDDSGKVISDSYRGKEYLGPAKVVADLESIFARPPATSVAQTH